MSNNGNTEYNNLFTSLISDVKSYDGTDPLLPWLRGIKKLNETLPPRLLKEKLPRFLQKCSESFVADSRYSNDLRYLRVWLQLMDFVDDPKPVLRTMEKNRIGMKKSLFYQAYALYYEKMKRFDAAEKIYHLGVQNLAEPADELQKSYEQFLHRLERHKNKTRRLNQCEFKGCHDYSRRTDDPLPETEVKVANTGNSRRTDDPLPETEVKVANTGNSRRTDDPLPETEVKVANTGNKTVPSQSSRNSMAIQEANLKQMAENPSNIVLNEQLVKKSVLSDSRIKKKVEDGNGKLVMDTFADDGIVNSEDARHHGLVEPTINTKEAMNAINSMFREPLETGRRSKNQSKVGNSSKNVFTFFTDESLEAQPTFPEVPSFPLPKRVDTNKSLDESFEIYIDGEEASDMNKKGSQALVFARPNDLPSECVKDPHPRRLLHEDTVVSRFVGSTISEEPEVENVCHHGLVDPTINLKEAMEDINNMFGEPIEFARKSRPKKHEKAVPEFESNCGEFMILPDDEPDEKVADMMSENSGFLILADDELDNQQDGSSAKNGSGLFEQTLCTKEAMAEINKLFAMPMDL